VTSDSDPDSVWRRPDGGAASADQSAPPAAADPQYTGPPATQRPPRVPQPAPLIQPPPPPRALPEQDHEAIDLEEHQARVFTYGIAIVAGVLGLLLFVFVAVKVLAGGGA